MENGKLFAGKFDQDGFLQGDGVYVNKKGNLFLGKFVDNELAHGKIIQYNGIIYIGQISKFKKEGENELEIKPQKYEFRGKFHNNKRIKGILTILNDPFVTEIEIKEYNENIKEKLDTCIKFKKDKYYEMTYEGVMENNKLNDNNGQITGYSTKGKKHEIYTYRGSVSDNSKNGYGIYYWNHNEYYEGEFLNNRPHTANIETEEDIKEFRYFGIVHSKGKKYKIIFQNGEVVNHKKFEDETVNTVV